MGTSMDTSSMGLAHRNNTESGRRSFGADLEGRVLDAPLIDALYRSWAGAAAGSLACCGAVCCPALRGRGGGAGAGGRGGGAWYGALRFAADAPRPLPADHRSPSSKQRKDHRRGTRQRVDQNKDMQYAPASQLRTHESSSVSHKRARTSTQQRSDNANTRQSSTKRRNHPYKKTAT